MRPRIHHPLFAGFLGVVGLLLVSLFVLVGNGLRRELDVTFRAELGRQLGLAEAIVSSRDAVDPDSLARAITDRIGYRVTLIDLDGWVIGDSYVQPGRLEEVENHADRPEVLGLVEDGETVSFARRTSATVGQPLLYGARVSTLNGEPVVLRIAAPQTDIENAVSRVQNTITVAGLLALFVALVGAYALSVVFARPLVVLADRARRLTEGDFSATAPPARVAELNDVGVAFNRLTTELQDRLSELGRERDEMQTLIDCMAEGVVALTSDGRFLRVNRTARALLDLPEIPDFATIDAVVTDEALKSALNRSVTEQGQSAELRIGGRDLLMTSGSMDDGGAVATFLDITDLRKMEQVRSDFVANASHELKTPLTAIRGFAETMVYDEPPADLRAQFAHSIHENTLRLQRLVDDLLDLSRLESGGWSADISDVPLRDVALEAVDLVLPGMDAGPHFDLTGDALVRGDRNGLVQVFRNLFENAVRHTPEGGVVQVTVEPDAAGAIRVSVSDDGEGVPPEALPRIFERFYRADSSRARDRGGTGLGLAIVKHLVGAMGGDVWAESQLGEGTTIAFTLMPARSGAATAS